MSSINPFYKRHFLRLMDFTPAQLQALLKLSADLKLAKQQGKETRHLQGKNIALIFEKTRPVPDALSKLPHSIRVLRSPISARAATRLVIKSR